MRDSRPTTRQMTKKAISSGYDVYYKDFYIKDKSVCVPYDRVDDISQDFIGFCNVNSIPVQVVIV